MGKTKQFNLLMVRDDGSRVLRLSIPTWVVGAVIGGFSVTLLGLAFIYPDYATLRHQRGAFTALSARLSAGTPASGPSVQRRARPSSTRSIDRGCCFGAGAARATWATFNTPESASTRPAYMAAPSASR